MLGLSEPNAGADEFGGSIDRLLKAFTRLTQRLRWKRAVVHWSRALEVTPGRMGTYITRIFNVLLIVPAEYFEPASLLYIGQAEWRLMWDSAYMPPADGSSISGLPRIRVRLRNT
jgi:hypothetical protein